MTSHKQNNTFEIQDAMKGLLVRGGDNSGYIELLRFNVGKGGSRAGVPVRSVPVWIFSGSVFVNFDYITRIDTTVGINVQCILYVFYASLSLRKYKVYVTGRQNNSHPKQVHCAGTVPPVLKLIEFSNESSAFTSQSNTHKLALLHFKALLLEMLFCFCSNWMPVFENKLQNRNFFLHVCRLEKQMLRYSFI